mmetsp:Transcript_20117/g.55655  ORF Transcript_20117/g.55655 Transcript_20117/m.55655 type:complete len:223 (+) Transcript_20117:981-1649(+)
MHALAYGRLVRLSTCFVAQHANMFVVARRSDQSCQRLVWFAGSRQGEAQQALREREHSWSPSLYDPRSEVNAGRAFACGLAIVCLHLGVVVPGDTTALRTNSVGTFATRRCGPRLGNHADESVEERAGIAELRDVGILTALLRSARQFLASICRGRSYKRLGKKLNARGGWRGELQRTPRASCGLHETLDQLCLPLGIKKAWWRSRDGCRECFTNSTASERG